MLVRDMKHPGGKDGNDTWCNLVPEAAAFIETMPRAAKEAMFNKVIAECRAAPLSVATENVILELLGKK